MPRVIERSCSRELAPDASRQLATCRARLSFGGGGRCLAPSSAAVIDRLDGWHAVRSGDDGRYVRGCYDGRGDGGRDCRSGRDQRRRDDDGGSQGSNKGGSDNRSNVCRHWIGGSVVGRDWYRAIRIVNVVVTAAAAFSTGRICRNHRHQGHHRNTDEESLHVI